MLTQNRELLRWKLRSIILRRHCGVTEREGTDAAEVWSIVDCSMEYVARGRRLSVRPAGTKIGVDLFSGTTTLTTASVRKTKLRRDF